MRRALAEKIGGIMGKEAEILERQVAFVRCKGTCENTKKQGTYVGVTDCRAAALGGINVGECDYGCMGLGSCVNVCPRAPSPWWTAWPRWIPVSAWPAGSA